MSVIGTALHMHAARTSLLLFSRVEELEAADQIRLNVGAAVSHPTSGDQQAGEPTAHRHVLDLVGLIRFRQGPAAGAVAICG